MPRTDPVDEARIAAALSQLPVFQGWEGRAVPRPVRRRLGEIDDRQLMMSVVVELLERLQAESP